MQIVTRGLPRAASEPINRLHRSVDRSSTDDCLDRLEQAEDTASRRLPLVHTVDHHAKRGGFSIVFAGREPCAIARTPQASNEFRISRRISGTQHDEIAIGAENREHDLRPSIALQDGIHTRWRTVDHVPVPRLGFHRFQQWNTNDSSTAVSSIRGGLAALADRLLCLGLPTMVWSAHVDARP